MSIQLSNDNLITEKYKVCVSEKPWIILFAYPNDSKEARESKIIRGVSASASYQFCFSLKLVISVEPFTTFSVTLPFVYKS